MTYSSSLAVGRQRYAAPTGRSNGPARNQNSVSFRGNERTLGPISNTIMLIVLACLLGLLYLTQVTKTNAYGYAINGLSQQQAQLQEEHDDLEIANARLQSLDRVRSSSVATSMVPVTPSDTVRN